MMPGFIGERYGGVTGRVNVTEGEIWLVPTTTLGHPRRDQVPTCLCRADVPALLVRAQRVWVWNPTYRHWDHLYSGWGRRTVLRQLVEHGWPVRRVRWWNWRWWRYRPKPIPASPDSARAGDDAL